MHPRLTSWKRTAHDFFEAQPHKSADIFFLKYIIHDWADADCITILSQLRASASPSTRLVVMERIIHHVGEGTAPEPLLKNWGQARIQPYLADMTVRLLSLSSFRSSANLLGR